MLSVSYKFTAISLQSFAKHLVPAKLFLAEARWAVGKNCLLTVGNSVWIMYNPPTTSVLKELLLLA